MNGLDLVAHILLKLLALVVSGRYGVFVIVCSCVMELEYCVTRASNSS